MKTSKKSRILFTILCILALTSSMVFAANSALPIGSTEQTKPSIESTYTAIGGVITEVSEEKDHYRVQVGEAQNGTVFILSKEKPIFILDQKTGKCILASGLTKGMTVSVVLDKNSPMTMSIPPQTSAALGVIITNNASDSSKTPATEAYQPLRSEAEKKGFTVTWKADTKQVILTKNDKKAVLTVDSNEFTYTHMTRDIQPLDNLEKMALPLKLENGKVMVSSDFLSALE